MQLTKSVSWNDAKKTRTRALFAAVLMALLALPRVTPTDVAHATASLKSVIVREAPGAGDGPETAIERFGGTVGQTLDIINGYVADVPASAVAELEATPGVHSVTDNAQLKLHTDLSLTDNEVLSLDLASNSGSTYWINNHLTGAAELWTAGFTGQGVDIALIDSGIAKVEGLSETGKVYDAIDYSFETNNSNVRYRDTFGHGTHMAAIIAGRDTGAVPLAGDTAHFFGVAPDARLVNVKVANRSGATDVAQVIAGLQWVVDNRATDGLNIRIVNLAFGTDGVQDYTLDPLAYAAEVAWHNGIVVVVAAGNEGYGSTKLNNPAYDPYVIAVGGFDEMDTIDLTNDVVGAWSSHGDGTRNPDVVAPGRSIVSLRSPGSLIDERYPDARLGTRFFKGTGTSQASAVVSGAAALLLEQRPGLTPDQVKALLTRTARPLPADTSAGQGHGAIDLVAASLMLTPTDATQTWTRSTGEGTLGAARGTEYVTADGVQVDETTDTEFGAFANDWVGRSWSNGAWSGRSWSGRSWSGRSWSGRSWSNDSWSGRSWSGRSWSGDSWSGRSWSSTAWE